MFLCRRVYNKVTSRFLPLNVCAIHRSSDQASDDFSASENDSMLIRKGVPLTVEEYSMRKKMQPYQPPDPHVLKVAMLGEPNVGKSTLTNRLIKWAVCSVSKKVHTTRKKTRAIFVEGNKQVVFVDTPGFVTPEKSVKHHLEVSLVADPAASVRESDLIAVIVDASCKWTNRRIHEDILALLNENKDKKSILILNKVDAQKNKAEMLVISRLLSRGAIEGILQHPISKNQAIKAFRKIKKWEPLNIEERTTEDVISDEAILNQTLEHEEGAKGWPFFSNIFMISALTGDGVDELREYLLNMAKPGDWLYHECNIIDRDPHELALTAVRGVLLDNLPQEIPYKLELKIKKWSVDDTGCLKVHIVVGCSKSRYKHLLIGKSGYRISKLVEECRQSLQNAFRCEILLKLGIE